MSEQEARRVSEGEAGTRSAILWTPNHHFIGRESPA
jgi:hypothetical protein